MTTENKLVENIRPIKDIVAESRNIAIALLSELEDIQPNEDTDDDAVVSIHFTRASIYKLITILMQLALVAAKNKPS